MISSSVCCTILVYLGMVCSLSDVARSHDIYVDPNNGNATNSTACWSGEVPCKTLEHGLKGLTEYNHTTLWVAAYTGGYTIQGSVNFKYENMSDIAIVGQDTDIPVSCRGEVGFTFLKTDNITIQNISLFGCGIIQTSTSKSFTMASNEFQFAMFYAVLYFLYCENVHLQSVTVSDSNGIGAVFYSTVGSNVIDNSHFLDNTAIDHSMPGGGGLYIEFSFCTPDADGDIYANCSVSNVPDYFSKDAQYKITHSTFQNNTASIVDPTNHTFILPQKQTHLAFGRGGGISVFFKGNAHNNSVTIDASCTLSNNTALWGAGLFVEFQDMTHGNQIHIEDSHITDNKVRDSTLESGTGGGGARIGFIFFDETHSHDNQIYFENVFFSKNVAYYGGGLSFYTARENTSTTKATNQVIFKNCLWDSNTARVGTAVDLSVWHPIPEGAIVQPKFSNCTFTRNNADYAEESSTGTFAGLGALYSDSIPVLFTDYVNFSHNTQTALAAVSTGIYFDSHIVAWFHKNTGRNGGALALMGYAFIQVSENTTLHFSKNSADLKGGAIYGHSIGEHDLISSRNCFFRYYDISVTPDKWNTIFYFSDNFANKDRNSIHVTSLLTCLWGGAFGSTLSGTSKVFCWNNHDITRWNYSPGSCSDNIATSPAAFSPNNHADNSYLYSMKVFPGKRKKLPFTTLDDQHNNVTNYTVLIAQVKNDSTKSVYLDSSSLYISDSSVEVHGKPNSTGTLRVETIDPRVISTQVRVTILDCPPGMIFSSNVNNTNSSCTCKPHSYDRLILCDHNSFTTQLQRGSWIGQVKNRMLVGQCPYCASINTLRYIDLPKDPSLLDEQLCGKINRTGPLCEKCKPGFGPAVNSRSFDCKKCTVDDLHRNWFFYLLTEFLPITIFFFIVVIFNVSVTSGPANAFVFFAQMTTTALTLDGDGTIQVNDVLKNGFIADDLLGSVPYDIWNLNFFRPYLPKFCLSADITTLKLLSTGYITALYPLILVGIFSIFIRLYSSGVRPIVCLLRPVHACFIRVRKIWDIQKSILHALATFLVLSYTKFTLVSFILLTTTPLVDEAGHNVYYRLYYAGSIEVGSPAHLPYLIPSLLVLCTFVAIPPIVLIIPSIMHLLQHRNCCQVPDLCGGGLWSQFLNAFHGCYKDGTGGEGDTDNKSDCRWFAGLYFILRIVLLGIYAFTFDWVIQTVLQLIVSVGALLAFVIFCPYKNDLYNKVDAIFFGCIIVLCSLSLQNYYSSVVEVRMPWWTFVFQYLLLIGPLVYMSIVVIYHLWNRNKTVLKKFLHRCLRKILRHGYRGDEEPVQTDDAFFQDVEEAGRFGERGESPNSRPSVQSGENEPLLQNDQPPPRSSGSSRDSGSGQRRSNESGSQYGAAQMSAGTQTPMSEFETANPSSFGSTGVAKFEKISDEEENALHNRRKNLFFTH